MSSERRTLILTDVAVDAVGTSIAPAGILVEWAQEGDPYPLGGEILAIGTPDEIRHHHLAKGAAVLVQKNAGVMPGMINAHTHLDLTHVGPQPHDPSDGFPSWGRMIMQRRETAPSQIRLSVRQGIDRAIAGGVVGVGDIAGIGSEDALDELRRSMLLGVSYLEYFGFGQSAEESFRRAEMAVGSLGVGQRVRLGLQPHAPYSASLELYRSLVTLGTPVCTHLAESRAEHDLIESATGDMTGLLREIGIWDENVAGEFGSGATPVEHLRGIIESRPMFLVHLNDVSDSDLDILEGADCTVAYCPRSSSYFGNDAAFGPHRYREMLDRGINVVLGTDSIVNLPPQDDGTAPTLSVLPEMRLLHDRDACPPGLLMEMATTRSARALGLDDRAFTLRPGPVAGLVCVGIDPEPAIEPIERVFRSSSAPHLLGPGARRALSARGVGA
ncbi:MAG: amidohydrolase family protein [Phycisphaerales bacterium JB043]